MRRIRTLLSAAAVFVAAALIVAFVPTQYVLRAPGAAVTLVGSGLDEPPVITDLAGADDASDGAGQIIATGLDQSGRQTWVTLGSVIVYFLMPDHDVLPRDPVYASGVTASLNEEAIHEAQDDALAAAASAAKIDVVQRAMIQTVRQYGPSDQLLAPGDFIVAIDDKPMSDANSVTTYIASRKVGDQVVVSVLRGVEEQKITIPALGASSTNTALATLGVALANGYSYSPHITVRLSDEQAGPAQGLALSLVAYASLTSTRLTASGRLVAAVGEVSATGSVAGVAGINEHLASARNARASMLIIPRENCREVVDAGGSMTIVPVSTLAEAIAAAQRPPDSPPASTC
ncbi:MAG: PDZ domain-containing protein [Propionibacteriaceae bacterium]|jgi:PDZ domain-containing protein|nr:PDZ domain-containing protein [Propionibacteriaceae bacterium]